MTEVKVVGIDPGPVESAFAVVDFSCNVIAADVANTAALTLSLVHHNPIALAVESIQSYGQIVGKSVFETCYTIGRIQQIAEYLGIPCWLYPRPEYGRAICGVPKVKDSVIRRALLNRFGGDKKGEPLHLLKSGSHKRSAFAVAVYHLDLMKMKAGAGNPAPRPLRALPGDIDKL